MAAALVLLLLAVFGGQQLRAATIDDSLVNGNEKKYEALLSTLKNAKDQNDDTILQTTLLYKLINLAKAKPPPPIKIDIPKDEKGYRELFASFLQWSADRHRLEKNIAEMENNQEVLREQIIALADNDRQTLTRQLQYAFYRRGSQIYRQQLQQIDRAMDLAPMVFASALRQLTFDTSSSTARLKKLQTALKKTATKIQENKLEEQRLKLLGRTDKAKKLEAAIAYLRQQRQGLFHDQLEELFIQFSAALQKKDNKIFSLRKEMDELLTAIDNAPSLRQDLHHLTGRLEKEILGTAATLKGATLQKLKTVLLLFWQRINAPILTFNKTSISTLKIFLALLIFILSFFLGQLYKNNIRNISPKSKTLTTATRTLLANMGYYAIILVAFFISLNVLGINITSIALVAGALSVGIGFGLQNIVSNFVSGLILMFERSIKIGDYIEVDRDLTGHVTDIRMRSITVNTNANIDVVIPNQDLVQHQVINWTMNDRVRRFEIPFSVAYGTDPDKVIEVVSEAVQQSGFSFLLNTASRHTRVVMTAMGESSLDFELFVWIRGTEIFYPKRTRSKFLILIYRALTANDIEIPFPQLDLHLRSVDQPLAPAAAGKDRQRR
ncbi:MAG: mechanosensitive ion channel [Deltaproteobacteria bacterium]|nr:mechanosensitive ion channel [Deltaproteobacteria bacterium]